MTIRPRKPLTTLTLPGVLAAAALLAVGCGSSGGSSASDSTSTTAVRIARTGYFDPIALAQDDGSLTKVVEAAGGKPTYTAPFGAFAPVAQALNSGAVDIGMGSITSAVGGLAGKTGFTIFAAQPPNTVDEGIVVPKDSPIHRVEDLEGKHVAVNKAGTGEYLLRKALALHHVDPSKVKLDYLLPPQAGPAFATGKLDAWSAWGNYTDTARAVSGGRFVATGRQIGSQNDIILVVRNEFLRDHPTIVRAIFDAARAETVKVADDPAAATALGNQTAKLPAPVASLQTAAFATEPPLQPVDDEVLRSFQEVADFFHDQGVVAQEADMRQHVVDVRTLPQAAR
jgi:sulfonate transport system substrate-binding protein